MTRHQIIRAEGADELVVLTRADYDALLAAAGDLDAEARAIERIVRQSDTAIASGEEWLVPDWLAFATARGEHPVRVVRTHQGRTQEAVAGAAGISTTLLEELERGARTLDADTRERLAAVLEVDERWLRDLFEAD